MFIRYVWDGPVSKAMTSVLSGVTLLSGAVIGGAQAYDVLGDLKLATHGFVKIELIRVHEGLSGDISKVRVALDHSTPILTDIQIEQAEGKLEATEEWLAKWKAEAANNTNTATAIGLAEGRIRDLQRQKEKLERQIDTLNAAKRNAQ